MKTLLSIDQLQVPMHCVYGALLWVLSRSVLQGFLWIAVATK